MDGANGLRDAIYGRFGKRLGCRFPSFDFCKYVKHEHSSKEKQMLEKNRQVPPKVLEQNKISLFLSGNLSQAGFSPPRSFPPLPSLPLAALSIIKATTGKRRKIWTPGNSWSGRENRDRECGLWLTETGKEIEGADKIGILGRKHRKATQNESNVKKLLKYNVFHIPRYGKSQQSKKGG